MGEPDTDQQRLFARFQEAYAAMLDHTDAQLGRLAEFLDSIGRLDNTIIVVLSDNGASQEGGPDGGADIVTYEEDQFCTVEFNLERFDTIGGPHSQTNIPWGWAQAANTPLRWYKQNTYAGGVRTPLVISWPQGISDGGAVRAQFVHAIDIAPTLFELVGVTPQPSYNGVDQMPYHGASIRQVLDDAESPPPRDRQYFEMIGHRAMWEGGWKALARHRRNEPFEDDPWELYHIDADFSECNDMADIHPDKLADLVRQWSEEAGRYSVFPLDDRYLAVRASTFQTPGSPRARDTFTYLGGSTRIPGGVTPLVFNRSFSITARVDPLDEADQGVLVAVGDVSGGYVLYLTEGRLVFEYCYLGNRQTVASAPASVTPSATDLAFRFERTGDYRGTGRLEADGVVLCEQAMSDMARGMISWGSLSVGADTLSPVSNSYDGEFPFSGNIELVDFALAAPVSRPSGDVVLVAGVGMTPFVGFRQDASVRDMVAEAARTALLDAGLGSTSLIDMGVAAYESDHFNRQMSLGQVLHDTVGLAGKPVIRVEGGGATGALAIRTAVMALHSGEARSVLVFGGETNGKSVDRATATEILAMSADFEWETPVFGTFAAPYALMITEHMRRYGTTPEQFAQIAVKNRRLALDNPLAHRGHVDHRRRCPVLGAPVGSLPTVRRQSAQ